MRKKNDNTLISKFPNYVLNTVPAKADPTKGDQIIEGTENKSDRTQKITKLAEYVAKIDGKKEFPWRVL